MGNYSFVTFYNDTRKTITREQGIKIQQILDGNVEPDNEAQATYALQVKRIDPLTVNGTVVDKKASTQALRTPQDVTSLTHEGILQGMNEAIPKGDR